MSERHRWLPVVWAVVLAALLLGPALGRGFLLTYDMVWVPDLAMRMDFWGLSTGLPRAVPSDAVVSLLDELLPGELLQKLVLLGTLVAGGLGAARLAPGGSVVPRLAAVTVFQWNPFVAERLLIGHWPVLVGYAVLPWVIVASRGWRKDGRVPLLLLFLVPLGSLSASAGLTTAVVLFAFAAARSRARLLKLAVLVLAANAPWLVSGLLHASAATTDGSGAAAFALARDGAVPAPLAALGLGGIWNAEVVLPSRDGPLAWVWLVVVLLLAGLGLRPWLARLPGREVIGFVVCWAVGWGVATMTWLAPGAIAVLVSNVPGAGIVRDGSRILALCAPLLVALVAHGVGVVWRRAPDLLTARAFLAGALVVFPVTLLPDAALGLSGRLDPVQFPPSYAAAHDAVEAAQDGAQRGDVLALPLSSYRQPAWNGRRKVLDPVGRYLAPDYVASDALVVSGTTLAGEDPRVEQVAEALRSETADDRARGLADLGIGYVVIERDAPGSAPTVTGRLLLDSPDLVVLALDGVSPRVTPRSWVAAMSLAWALFGGCLLAGVVRATGSWNKRVTRGKP